MKLTEKDSELINLLRGNARCSISELARQMKVSRAAVQQRFNKLEQNGTIDGFTVVLSDEFLESQVRALIMIKFPPNKRAKIVTALNLIRQVAALYSISGTYDMAGVIAAQSMQELDRIIDQIGCLQGIEQTMSSIILSTKIMR